MAWERPLRSRRVKATGWSEVNEGTSMLVEFGAKLTLVGRRMR